MSLRIPHPADNHIGLSYDQYPEPARERLIENASATTHDDVVADLKGTLPQRPRRAPEEISGIWFYRLPGMAGGAACWIREKMTGCLQ